MTDTPKDDKGSPRPEGEPQAASGTPDGTIPKLGIPIEVFTQAIAVPTPDAAENIRAMLEPHESDACRRGKDGQWVYERTRAFVDLKKAFPPPTSTGDGTETPIIGDRPNDNEHQSTILGPDGAPVA